MCERANLFLLLGLCGLGNPPQFCHKRLAYKSSVSTQKDGKKMEEAADPNIDLYIA